MATKSNARGTSGWWFILSGVVLLGVVFVLSAAFALDVGRMTYPFVVITALIMIVCGLVAVVRREKITDNKKR